MAITIPATPQLTTAAELVLPAMAKQPLQRSLENINHLMKWYRPPLVDLCPTQSRTTVPSLVYPIRPAADGLLYTFEARVTATSTTPFGGGYPPVAATCTVLFYYCTSYTGPGTTSWTGLCGGNVTSSDTGAVTVYTGTATIPADAVALAIVAGAAAGANILLHHVLVYPSPTTVTLGKKTSGAIPFDDGMLNGTAGSPVHTEFINRCQVTPSALQADRWQQCLSFAQNAPTAAPQESLHLECTDTDGAWLPEVTAYFPGQTTVKLRVYGLATVDSGTNTDVFRVRLTDSKGSVQNAITADGTLRYFDRTVYPEGPDGKVRICIGGKASAVDRTTYIHAVSGFWKVLG